ncbi:hypothetical protein HMI56_007074 [Coelomomyces lativittatus]|nr:hypothetical protein HMI56_007074 [Coelomomyces lativittatus]
MFIRIVLFKMCVNVITITIFKIIIIFYIEAEPTKPEASSLQLTNRKRKHSITSEDPESLEWIFKNSHSEAEASSSHFTKRKRKHSITSEDPESSKWILKNSHSDPLINGNLRQQQPFLQGSHQDPFVKIHADADLGLDLFPDDGTGMDILEDFQDT